MPSPRKRPSRAERLEALVGTAAAMFIERGYRRTQIADVAEAVGLAKGSVYVYFDSKVALFDLVLRHADDPASLAGLETPAPTPAEGETAALVKARVREELELPTLSRALDREAPAAARAELEAVLREIYATLDRNRMSLKIIDRCALDRPDLAAVFFEHGRRRLMGLLERWLDRRARGSAIDPPADVAVTARIILETLTFWAVHRHWDPAPQEVDDDVARESALAFVLNAVAPE